MKSPSKPRVKAKHRHKYDSVVYVSCSCSLCPGHAYCGCKCGKKEHSPFHKMVIVIYRDGEYVECTECDFTEKI